MTNNRTTDDSGLQAIEKALTLPKTSEKNFAPPPHRGIHELISEVREGTSELLRKLEIIEQRMVEFDRLQTSFYNGK